MKNLEVNIGSFVKRRGAALLLVGTLSLTSLSGCSRAECDILNYHAHMYVNEEGYVRYIRSEREELEGYRRSYNSREIAGEDIKLYNFSYNNGLLRIDENIELILAQQEKNTSFTAYEYSKSELTSFGKMISSTTNYYWTNDPNHDSLTGKEEQVHYIYQAYRIEQDENGSYFLVPAPIVEDITEVMEEYPYIKEDYFIPVDKNNIGIKVEDDLAKKVEDDKVLRKTNE